MSETVKATIIGTLIIGIFMLISVNMASNRALYLARSAKQYIEAQKQELKHIVKQEKAKAKELAVDLARISAENR